MPLLSNGGGANKKKWQTANIQSERKFLFLKYCL